MSAFSFYLLAKTLHVVGFVSWFAGQFFLVRLFVNHVEALEKTEPARSVLKDAFEGMERRVYGIIMGPAAVLTWFFGASMVALSYKIGQEWLSVGWFQVKLCLLTALTAYHFYCGSLMRRLAAGKAVPDSFGMRLLNEVPTLFLVAIALLGVFQSNLRPLPTVVGLAAFAGLMFWGAKKYRETRTGQ